jgi:hypothetical protein
VIKSVLGTALLVSQANAQTPPQPGPGTLPAADETLPAPEPVRSVATEQPTAPPMPPSPPQPVAAEPQVTGTAGAFSTSNALLLVGSGAGLAAGLCLFLAAANDDGDADAVASYDDHDRIATRATRLRIASVISAGAGVALGALAVYRLRFSKEGTELSFTPKKGGGTLVLERSW